MNKLFFLLLIGGLAASYVLLTQQVTDQAGDEPTSVEVPEDNAGSGIVVDREPEPTIATPIDRKPEAPGQSLPSPFPEIELPVTAPAPSMQADTVPAFVPPQPMAPPRSAEIDEALQEPVFQPLPDSAAEAVFRDPSDLPLESDPTPSRAPAAPTVTE